MLNHRTDLHLERLREAVTWGRARSPSASPAWPHGMASTLGANADAAALSQLAGMVRQQAMVMAFSDVFLMIAAVFVGVLFLIPLARRPRPAGPRRGTERSGSEGGQSESVT